MINKEKKNKYAIATLGSVGVAAELRVTHCGKIHDTGLVQRLT